MPYRRLPNTDNARIRALKTAVNKKRFYRGADVFSVDLLKMENHLRNFEASQVHYKNSLEIQVSSNKKFQRLVRDARLYVSHFIQVLNLCIIRHELKESVKKYYKLPLDGYAVPDLSNNEALLEVGGNTIDGEQARLLDGGIPIYNPTIARVNVAFSLFKDAYFAQKLHQSTTNRHLEELTAQRADIDRIIKDIWDQVEDHFKNVQDEDERLNKCREYGVVYYYRKGELNKEQEAALHQVENDVNENN